MRSGVKIISWFALAGTIVPPMLFFAGRITLEQSTAIMLAATILWFATAPFWMDRTAEK